MAELDALNPHAKGLATSLVKLEDENFFLLGEDENFFLLGFDQDGKPVVDRTRPTELRAVAVSAKRYALYNRDGQEILIRKASNHGLGLYRSPIEAKRLAQQSSPAWIEDVWRSIIREVEGTPAVPEPAWLELPAVGHLPVSSPHVPRAFRAVNAGFAYRETTKPFGFLLVGHVDPFAPLPPGLRPGEVIPMAPYSTKPDEFLDLPWVNRRSGARIEVTSRPNAARGAVRLRTYGDVIVDYRLHPEQKSAAPDGAPASRGSVGLLARLHVVGDFPIHIGKESNRLQEEEEGALADLDDPYTEYRDERAEWAAALPALRRLREARGWRYLAEASGLSERALRYALNGGMVPRREARERLLDAATESAARSGHASLPLRNPQRVRRVATGETPSPRL